METKVRLVKIKKSQRELLNELKKRGFTIYEGELSEMLSGEKKTPKTKIILKECNKIINEWKKEGKKKCKS